MTQQNFENNPNGQSYNSPNDMLKRKPRSTNQAMEYQLLRDAYYGSGGFSDGMYLQRHKREKTEKYTMRRNLCYYLNYTAPCVNSHVDPIFRDAATRDFDAQGGTNGDLFAKYLEDVDTNGTPMARFMKRVGIISKLMGVCLVVTDNFAVQPGTVDTVLKDRVLPYSYALTPDRVTDFKTNKQGRLISISYTEPIDVTDYLNANQDKPGGPVPEYQIRTWTETDWSLADKEGKPIGTKTPHSLKRVPVTVVPSRPIEPDNVLPPSEFLSIAKTNLAIFQLCSWLTEILQNQAFSILVYPSKQKTDIVVGTDNALGYDGAEAKQAPHFIAPPADPAKILGDTIDKLIAEIYRMAAVSHVTGVQQAKSGVAKAYDFAQTNQALADMADNLQNAEKDMSDVFGRWIGADVGYNPAYPDDFGIIDVEQELKDAQAAIDFRLPSSTFILEVARKILAAYLPNLDTEIQQKIMDEIASEGIDHMMAGRYGYDVQGSKAIAAAKAAATAAQTGVVPGGKTAPKPGSNKGTGPDGKQTGGTGDAGTADKISGQPPA